MDLFDFTWPIDNAGYHLEMREEQVDLGEISGHMVSPTTVIKPNGGSLRRCRSIEKHTGLFRRFANLDPDEPSTMIEFADSFGLLTNGGLERGEEDPSLWAAHIIRMRQAIEFVEGDDWAAVRLQFNEDITSDVSVALVAQYDDERPRFVVRPKSLLTAMRLQLAEWVAGDRKMKKCIFCPEWFFFGPGTDRRETARYCSARCQKAHTYQRSKGDSQ